jgi:P27 family predicted phage terminase small subunit
LGNRNSGRKPKPYALKALEGNRGKRKLVDDEPKPPPGPVVKPETLSHGASVVWERQAPICLEMGTLTAADVLAFAKLCELEATAITASGQKDREGFTAFLVTTVPDPDGEVHVKISEHPAIKMERATAQALRPFYEYFGLVPVGRARIHISKPEGEQKWAALA